MGHYPAFSDAGTHTPDNLIAGDFPCKRKNVTIQEGQNLVRGTILMAALAGVATSAAKSGGNTGGGTLTLDATTPVLPGSVPGIYTVRCIEAASNSGTFRVTAPDGVVLGDIAVGSTFSNQLKFAIADVGADFIVGDGFDITVTDAPVYIKATSNPLAELILAEDCNATDEDTSAVVYSTGEFNINKVIVGAGATAAGCKRALEARNIYLLGAVA